MTRRPEQQVQRAVIQHLAWRPRPGVWWTHIPLGGLRSKVEAAILRGLGTARGTPDLLIVADGKARASVCALPKNIAATKKLAMWAMQQPQRGGTTSCASSPSAGIDRAKCLISLEATGEEITILSTVGRGDARRPRPGGLVADRKAFRARGPLRAT